MNDAELKKLIDSYEPNEEVLKTLSTVSLVGTVGGVAVGKTTTMWAAISSKSDPKMKLVLSDVSRQIRLGEVDGRDYYFLHKPDLIKGLQDGLYVQAALGLSGDIYATSINSYPDATEIGTMAIWYYALDSFRKLPFKRLDVACIVPQSFELWQAWIKHQANASNWTDEHLKVRHKEAMQSFEYSLADKDMIFILNDSPDAAGERLKQVARGESPDKEATARELAQSYLQKLIST